jgi:glycosyltransferase involved in cell wall biosynthesis
VTPIRLVRVISRLNIGGPAIQAISLTERLRPLGYETLLIRGSEDPDEGSMDYLANELGVRPMLLRSLRRNPGLQDLPALLGLIRALRAQRPRVVHSHAAKAGTLGRLAALVAFPPGRRPVIVHTFHGHSLSGYFSRRSSAAFRRIEQFLARHTDRLIAVSAEVRDELVELGVAPRDKFAVVPLGFDLSAFLVADAARADRRRVLRAELGIAEDARLVTLVARLVPIKRVDRFLRVANLLREAPDVTFMIVGDGELRDRLRAAPEARALGDRVLWAGFRRDMPGVYFASDVVVQTSDNEGTPVALIEAQAAGVPVVSTAVGGVRSAVLDGETGRIVAVDDDDAMAGAIRAYLDDPIRRHEHGARGRRHAEATFTLRELVLTLDRLYRGLLAR